MSLTKRGADIPLDSDEPDDRAEVERWALAHASLDEMLALGMRVTDGYGNDLTHDALDDIIKED